ncbi:MAG: glycosyltransferase family 4 protein [Candidatus Gastranaerophilales bacterium]|nr:glycosyltransferase family 4 protein [Candidatus Gastranaerophilales bacterium]
MKILFVNDFLKPLGGAETYIINISQLLEKKGCKVFFFATNTGSDFEENYKYLKYFPEYLNMKNSSKLHQFKNFFNFFYDNNAKKKFEEYINEIKPDLVHISSILYYLTPSIIDVCSKKNIPIISTLHGVKFVCPSNLMRSRNIYCDKAFCLSNNIMNNIVNCISNKCKGKNAVNATISMFKIYLYRKYMDKIDYFICPSQAMYDFAVKAGIDTNKMAIIPNYVSDLYLQDVPDYDSQQYFLYAGRLSREKGVHYLLKAMEKLPDIKLRIAGVGQEEENLKKMARANNLKNVEFIGFKTGEEFKKEYKNCIASILPSNCLEAFGLTIVESFALGKPVIGSNIGGIAEIIKDGINGITFEPGNIDELANAIYRLNQDKNSAINMGKNGRNMVEKFYNAEHHSKKLIQSYELLTKQKVKLEK